MTPLNASSNPAELADLLKKLQDNVGSVLLGKPDVIRLAMVALLADGHLLLEDVPGVGKTLLAKALARSLDCTFHRIQFTPDLLPSDLIGTSIYNSVKSEFTFQPGPLFAQVVLADEINRATPRTQSALLEAMSEKQVSIDLQTRPLGPPFFVLATQNPYEFEGTYPLPENQLDRFLLRTQIGYPDRQAERDLLIQHRAGEPVDSLQPVIQAADVVMLQQRVREVKIAEAMADYILDIVEATRKHPEIALGASTRALLGYYRAIQAWAFMNGRDYGIPDDAKFLGVPVLAHRLLSRRWTQGVQDDTATRVVKELLSTIAVPN